MNNFTQNRTKRLTALAMLVSMAFMVGATFRLRGAFAAAPFLTYDPKDVVILLGGFMFGPLSALLMSVVVALLEMATVSISGLIGALMNAISSASFTCTAAFVYSKKRNLQGAIIGLVLGCIAVVITMSLWNLAIIPLYVPHATFEGTASLILPVIIPFNAIKAALNAAIALLIYKKVSSALNAAGLYKEALTESPEKRLNITVMVVSAIIAVALVAALFIIRGNTP